MKKSFYEILEVSNSASQEAIDAVYAVLQKKYSSLDPEQHPEATEQLKFIQIAYGVIANPAKRAVYDKRLAKAGAEPTPIAPAVRAEQPAPPAGPAPAAPIAPTALTADKELVKTPIDLIAQLKEANRNTGPREDFGERIVSIATKPLVAAIIGLVFVGSATYKLMKPATRSNTPGALAKQGAFSPDPVASTALDAAQKLASDLEAGMNYGDYSKAVPAFAVQTKAYLASGAASKNPKLGNALQNLLDAHVKARDVWAIKIENPDLFSNVDADNQHYQKILAIYPPAAQMAKPHDELRQSFGLDIDAVLNALWQEARRAFNDARRLNSGAA